MQPFTLCAAPPLSIAAAPLPRHRSKARPLCILRRRKVISASSTSSLPWAPTSTRRTIRYPIAVHRHTRLAHAEQFIAWLSPPTHRPPSAHTRNARPLTRPIARVGTPSPSHALPLPRPAAFACDACRWRAEDESAELHNVFEQHVLVRQPAVCGKASGGEGRRLDGSDDGAPRPCHCPRLIPVPVHARAHPASIIPPFLHTHTLTPSPPCCPFTSASLCCPYLLSPFVTPLPRRHPGRIHAVLSLTHSLQRTSATRINMPHPRIFYHGCTARTRFSHACATHLP